MAGRFLGTEELSATPGFYREDGNPVLYIIQQRYRKKRKNLADNAGSGNWLDGARFSGRVSEEELSSWINSLK